MATSEASDELKAQAQRDAETALAEPLNAFQFFLDGRDFIGGSHPSIADIRLCATLEFLKAIDYDFPQWTTTTWSGRVRARRRVLGARGRRPRLRGVG